MTRTSGVSPSPWHDAAWHAARRRPAREPTVVLSVGPRFAELAAVSIPSWRVVSALGLLVGCAPSAAHPQANPRVIRPAPPPEPAPVSRRLHPIRCGEGTCADDQICCQGQDEESDLNVCIALERELSEHVKSDEVDSSARAYDATYRTACTRALAAKSQPSTSSALALCATLLDCPDGEACCRLNYIGETVADGLSLERSVLGSKTGAARRRKRAWSASRAAATNASSA